MKKMQERSKRRSGCKDFNFILKLNKIFDPKNRGAKWENKLFKSYL